VPLKAPWVPSENKIDARPIKVITSLEMKARGSVVG
jgi:hypothetical protein